MDKKNGFNITVNVEKMDLFKKIVEVVTCVYHMVEDDDIKKYILESLDEVISLKDSTSSVNFDDNCELFNCQLNRLIDFMTMNYDSELNEKINGSKVNITDEIMKMFIAKDKAIYKLYNLLDEIDNLNDGTNDAMYRRGTQTLTKLRFNIMDAEIVDNLDSRFIKK